MAGSTIPPLRGQKPNCTLQVVLVQADLPGGMRAADTAKCLRAGMGEASVFLRALSKEGLKLKQRGAFLQQVRKAIAA